MRHSPRPMPAPALPTVPGQLLHWTYGERGQRQCVLLLRAGDPPPAAPEERQRRHWWSGWSAEVAWDAPDTWLWRIWAPRFRGVGEPRREGDANTARLARMAATGALLVAVPELTAWERRELTRLANGHAPELPR